MEEMNMKILIKELNEVKELTMLDKNGFCFANDWISNLGAEMYFDSNIDMYVMSENEFYFWKKAVTKESDLNEFLSSFSVDFQIELKDRLSDLYENDIEEYPSIYNVFDLLKLDELSKFNAVEFVKIDSKNYECDEFKLYCAEAGWQNWMIIYREDDTIEERDYLYESEIKSIEEIQKNGFKKSHGGF